VAPEGRRHAGRTQPTKAKRTPPSCFEGSASRWSATVACQWRSGCTDLSPPPAGSTPRAPPSTGCAEHAYWDAPPPLSGSQPVRTRVVVDVISGTLAGGVNGVLAKAVAHSLPQESLHNPWFTEADIGRMRAGPSFLLPRGKLHEALSGIVALMADGHVLPEAPDAADAMVVSGSLVSNGRRRRFRAVWRWWYEPSDGAGLDTTELELDADPDTVTPVPLARRPPNLAAKDSPRTDLIGHPRGLEQPQPLLQHNLPRDGGPR
jgi:hypothetical protein